MIIISLFYYCKKGIYPYEYMDNWERFNETSLLEKEHFYSHLNMEDNSDTIKAYFTKVVRCSRLQLL